MIMESDYEFHFAISFAGPHRHIAEKLAIELKQHGYLVFYDETYQSRLLGRRLHREFKWIYGEGTWYFVPIVSEAYVERPWPQLEWSIAMEEAARRPNEFILPVRLDDAILLGLSNDVSYLDLRQSSITEIAQILADKLPWPHKRAPVYFASKRWVATFGLTVTELHSSEVLPSNAPRDYPHLCDWLEHDLMRRLEKAAIHNPSIPEASARNGETLSVRIAFDWVPGEMPLEFRDLYWWEVLEVLPFDQVYNIQGT